MSASTSDKQARVSTPRLLGFASLGLPIAGAMLPLTVYLPPFYAQNFGLGLGLVGTVFMLSRLWDAACDPLIGILSDRTRTRFGRRKPWIAAGAPLFIVALFAVFQPGESVSAVYLGGWLFILYLGWSMISTPLYAWSGELSRDYHERSRVQAYLQTAVSLGLLLILLIPAGLDQFGLGDQRTKIAAMGLFTLATLIPGLLIVLIAFRERPVREAHGQPALGRALWQSLRSPLVIRVMGSDFFVALGQGIRGSLFVFFVTAYMGLPAWASALFLTQFVFGVFASPLWLQIGYRLGKQRTVLLSELLQVTINLGLLLVAPGQIWPLIALTVAQGLSQGSGNLMLRAIVSDVADHQRLKTGAETSGFLFSIFNVTHNAAAAVAVGLSFALLSLFGFVPGAQNGGLALTGLHLVFALGPAAGHLLSATLIWRFPLNEREAADVARTLEAHDRDFQPVPAE